MTLNNSRVYILVVVVLVSTLIGTLYIVKKYVPLQMSAENTTAERTYSSSVYGISFIYPPTYILSESDAPGSGMRKHHVITLTNKEDFVPPQDGEGPPTINIDIYQNNLDGQTTEGWIRNTSESNFKLGAGVLASTTVGGLPALSYRWSGLYEGSTIVTARPSWVYAFTVNYFEMGDEIVQDFVAIRNSVRIAK